MIQNNLHCLKVSGVSHQFRIIGDHRNDGDARSGFSDTSPVHVHISDGLIDHETDLGCRDPHAVLLYRPGHLLHPPCHRHHGLDHNVGNKNYGVSHGVRHLLQKGIHVAYRSVQNHVIVPLLEEVDHLAVELRWRVSTGAWPLGG